MTRKMKKTEIWRREDGWEVFLCIENDTVTASHLPLIVTPRPIPLTYEYAAVALSANGYRLEETEEL